MELGSGRRQEVGLPKSYTQLYLEVFRLGPFHMASYSICLPSRVSAFRLNSAIF